MAAYTDIIKYDGPLDQSEWVVFRHPAEEIACGTKLVVGPGQQVLRVKEGECGRTYDTGAYVLEAESGLGLSKLFGDRGSFGATVYFLNKTSRLDMMWGTATPFQMEDPKYGIIVSIRGRGKYGVRVEEPDRFIAELVGSVLPGSVVSKQFVNTAVTSLMISQIQAQVSRYMTAQHISFLEVTSHLPEMSKACSAALQHEFASFGISIVNLTIETISPPASDFEALKKLKDKYALGEDLYMKERKLDLLDKLAENAADPSAALEIVLEHDFGGKQTQKPVAVPLQQAAPAAAAAPAPKKSDKVQVFISFKNTYHDEKTRDSQMADQVFKKLISMNYNVFMMNDTLFKKGASNYKRIIDESLEQASCLIVIGSRREFVESEWVRYEWDTYLTEVLAGRKHDDNIFTLRVDGMGISDLPISLRKYQSFGLDELDTLYMWVHNALEGIKDDTEEDETPLYPVVFTPNESGYTVTVPDLELKAEARDLKKAFRRAKALMNSYHSYTRRCGEELAPPSEYEAMCEKYPNATVMLLALDPLPEKEETAEE